MLKKEEEGREWLSEWLRCHVTLLGHFEDALLSSNNRRRDKLEFTMIKV